MEKNEEQTMEGARIIAVSRRQWNRWQELAARLQALTQTHIGYALVRADEERAVIEAELADELLALMEVTR